jgi:hypothetical protein
MIADFCSKCNTTKPCKCPGKYDGHCDKSSHDDLLDALKSAKSALEVALAFVEKRDGRITEKDTIEIINSAIKQVERDK